MPIRNATMADTATLAKQHLALTNEMSRLAPDTIRPVTTPDPAYFAKYIVDDNGLVLVADNGAGINGFAVAVIASTQDAPEIVPQRFLYVLDLYVVPQARRQGQATALMDAVDAFAKQKGVAFVELNVLGQDNAARKFYASRGFAPQSLTLTHQL